MAYQYALSNIYNHYLTTYAPKSATRYDAHKKSDLRDVYNSIVKLNKESPLSIVDTSEAAQKYVVGIKENARELRNTITSLSGSDETELLNRKIAYSSDASVVDAKFIGDISVQDENESLELGVEQLAQSQINTGNYLRKEAMAMPSGTYSFDISINNTAYEFQFNINPGDTNFDLQNKLSRLINNANVGIKAEVKEYDNSHAALSLESTATGIDLGHATIFDITDDNTSKHSGIVDYLGLNEVSRHPQNAVFTLNGDKRVSYTNHFTVEGKYELNLQGLPATQGETVTIGLKPDTESLTENIHRFIGGYNDFIKAAQEYRNSQPKSSQLIREMSRISGLYNNELGSLGISLDESGIIQVDDSVLKAGIDENGAKESLNGIKRFANAVLNKTNAISLNPMDYVNKTIVAYKNPGKNYAPAYITSQYSGMMFNSYV
ncbi:MAG: flagellar filament capping protein FliD [Lachnospiraceae bacterium]|nr:flagellar filament capping protein FliD [Lachnospiraceae bacterium]